MKNLRVWSFERENKDEKTSLQERKSNRITTNNVVEFEVTRFCLVWGNLIKNLKEYKLNWFSM